MGIFDFGLRRKALKAYIAASSRVEQAMTERAFEAARMMREVADWAWDGGFSNSDVLGALPLMRARSRDMAKNSPLYARYIQLMRENVVGDGFRLKPLPYRDPSRPDEVDEDAAKFLDYHWWKWGANPGLADVGRRLTLVQLIQLAVECWVRDGEAFIVMDRAAPTKYGFALRLVRADCIDETLDRAAEDGRAVKGGIEFDVATNTPVAYWFDGRRADGTCAMTWKGRSKVRIPAGDVIHLFERHDAEQVRGVPIGYPALVTLKMLDEYTKAELVAARHEASTVGVFTAPIPTNLNYDLGKPSAEQRAEASRRVQSGSDLWLPPGWGFNSYTPNHPNRGWADYSLGLQRLVATGLGVDFTELTGNAAGSLSVSVRQAMLRTREMYKAKQALVVSLVMDRLYHSWLRSFLSLDVSGAYSLADFDRLCDHQFMGRRWGWVDPSAEMNAATTAVAHGWRTDAEVAADYGNDIDENIAEAARIRDAKAAAGLVTVGNALNAAQPPANEDPDTGKGDLSQEEAEKIWGEVMEAHDKD